LLGRTKRIARAPPMAFSAVIAARGEALFIGVYEARGQRFAAGGETRGDGEAAQQLGVDAFGVGAAAGAGAGEVAELEVRGAARFGARGGVQLGRRGERPFAEVGQFAFFGAGDEAGADRFLAREDHLARRRPQRVEDDRLAFAAGDRRVF